MKQKTNWCYRVKKKEMKKKQLAYKRDGAYKKRAY